MKLHDQALVALQPFLAPEESRLATKCLASRLSPEEFAAAQPYLAGKAPHLKESTQDVKVQVEELLSSTSTFTFDEFTAMTGEPFPLLARLFLDNPAILDQLCRRLGNDDPRLMIPLKLHDALLNKPFDETNIHLAHLYEDLLLGITEIPLEDLHTSSHPLHRLLLAIHPSTPPEEISTLLDTHSPWLLDSTLPLLRPDADEVLILKWIRSYLSNTREIVAYLPDALTRVMRAREQLSLPSLNPPSTPEFALLRVLMYLLSPTDYTNTFLEDGLVEDALTISLLAQSGDLVATNLSQVLFMEMSQAYIPTLHKLYLALVASPLEYLAYSLTLISPDPAIINTYYETFQRKVPLGEIHGFSTFLLDINWNLIATNLKPSANPLENRVALEVGKLLTPTFSHPEAIAAFLSLPDFNGSLRDLLRLIERISTPCPSTTAGLSVLPYSVENAP